MHVERFMVGNQLLHGRVGYEFDKGKYAFR